MSAAAAGLGPSHYTPLQRRLEIAGITAFFSLTAVAVARFVTVVTVHRPEPSGTPWLVAAGLVAALLFADFISGVVHWLADNWGSPAWPILGTGFIAPFRYHHVDPEEMTRHGFVELNGNNCIISVPTFLCALGQDFEGDPASGLFWGVFWVGVAYWVLGTNQFHAWAHSPSPPRLARWLQRARLILSRGHHDVHHAPPHNRNYCITNGWMNPALRALRFFELLEWTVTKLSGIRPAHRGVIVPELGARL